MIEVEVVVAMEVVAEIDTPQRALESGLGRWLSSSGMKRSAEIRAWIRIKLTRQDFDPVEDPPRLAKVLRRSWREGAPGVFDGFRIG
jgi:hypothetical protein